ncbi:MAG: hypothetical protein IPJ36_17895 [Simplicispira sp.]|nr:hypothetical protein [Simplicispira sp.]
MTNIVAKFAEVKSGQDNDAKNDWFKHCQSTETPYIIITKRTKFADVLWDHISYSEKQEMAFRESEEPFRKKRTFSATIMEYIYRNATQTRRR